jgi:single-strand DNA-binding protein
MFDTYMTVIGNLVDNPRMRLTKNGHPVTNFRIASTSRRFDTEKNSYVDNSTLFVNVTCWRAQAENAFASLKKGHPVVVTGRYYSREYTIDETTRIAYELEANAVGHDLSRGISDFRKVVRTGVTHVPVDAEGLPADESDRWLGVIAAGSHQEDAPDQARVEAPREAGASASVDDELAEAARPLVAVS